jgi:hypothetical protein
MYAKTFSSRSGRFYVFSLLLSTLVLMTPSPVAFGENKSVCTYMENNLRADLLLLHSQLQHGNLLTP